MENIKVTVSQEWLDNVARPEHFNRYQSNIGTLECIRGDFYKVRMDLVNILTDEKYSTVINVLKDRAELDAEEIKVRFEGGQSRNGETAVDYMIARVGDVELYAEQPAEDDDEPWTEDLEHEIIRQAREAGIDTRLLAF